MSENEQIEKHGGSVCYIDAAIQSNAGHHANACRHFVGEFRRRGFVVHPYGNQDLDSSLAKELHIQPLFRHLPYARPRGEGSLSYFVERSSFLQDVKSVWRRNPCDIMFFHSPLAAQFAAVALWLQQFHPDESPFVIVGFDTPTGNRLPAQDHFHYYTRFYRKAAKLFKSRYLPRTLLFTFDATVTNDYAEVLNLPIQTMPVIYKGLREPRLRERDVDGLITIAFLGHQRIDKGYHLVPEIVRNLLEQPLKFLIHDSGRIDFPAISQQLRTLASENPRVAFVEKPGDQSYWQDLLDHSDLIVLPYEPNQYHRRGSGVATEAVSQGIPMVVPSGSTMETLAIRYQGCATTFPTWDFRAVALAIERAAANFEILAKQAEAGAGEWRLNNGVALFVDRVFNNIATFKKRPFATEPSERSISDAVIDRVLTRLVFGRRGPVRRQR